MRTRALQLQLRLLGILGICLIALGVHAEPTAMDRAAAEALFDEALILMDAGNAASACPKLEESQKLDPGVGTLLYLAACYETLGRTASAWGTFTEAAYAAKDLGQLDRETIALENAARLKPLLSRLVVEVAASETEGLVVQSDEKPLSRAMWGSEIPVDPGLRRVTASAPKKQTWTGEVEVPAQGVARLTVPELLDEIEEPALLAPVPPPAPSEPYRAPTDINAGEDPGATQRLWGWVGVGVGSAAIVAGGVFGFLAVTDNGRADDACRRDDPSLCSERGVELGDSAETKANVASILGGAGAAIAITGAVLVLTAPEADEVSLLVSPTEHGGALLLGGTF